ncbi:MAG: dCTP deaminase [Thermoplasmata archaeon]
MLSDSEIINAINDKVLEITNFNVKNITPNGYDVTIGEITIPLSNTTIKNGKVMVPPNTRFAINTKEYFKFSKRIVGEIWIRTSWARRGIISSFGIIDAGFEGTLNFFAFNASEKYVEVSTGERFAQIVFFRLENGADKGYDERSGTYQNQKDIIMY